MHSGMNQIRSPLDEVMIRLWLDRRSRHTRRAYETDARSLLRSAGKPLSALTLADLEAWAASFAGLSQASRARKISAVKSLLSWGTRRGFLANDLGAGLCHPRSRNRHPKLRLTQADAGRLIALEPNRRNQVMLRLCCAIGLRTSELCSLHWRDATPRADGGQITIKGRGGNARVAPLAGAMWSDVMGLKGSAAEHDPVFRSRKGGPLDPSQVHRIVKQAAIRAGLTAAISADHLRYLRSSADRP